MFFQNHNSIYILKKYNKFLRKNIYIKDTDNAS